MACHEDRLSNLPAELMANILSRLSMTDAVATCVLSKDWVQKWTCIYNVDITDDKLLQKQDHKPTFPNFLRKVLLFIDNPHRIHLKLSMTSWREVDDYSGELLNLSNVFVDFVLHERFLNVGSLIDLSFQFLTCKIPTESYFPNLIILRIKKVRVFNEDANTETLIFNLPVAKEIFLQNCYWSATRVEIHAPELNRFMSGTAEMNCHHDYTISIVDARLENFSSFDILENFNLPGSIVVSANLKNSVNMRDVDECFSYSALRVGCLLEKLSSSVEDLTLSFFLVQAFLDPREGYHISTFRMLQKLVLRSDGYDCIGGCTEDLLELLDATPILKILVINMEEWDSCDYDVAVCIPSCIVSTLEAMEFCILSHDHVPEAIDLAKFLLKNGRELKRFEYLISDDQSEDDIMEELSSFAIASIDVIISVQIR